MAQTFMLPWSSFRKALMCWSLTDLSPFSGNSKMKTVSWLLKFFIFKPPFLLHATPCMPSLQPLPTNHRVVVSQRLARTAVGSLTFLSGMHYNSLTLDNSVSLFGRYRLLLASILISSLVTTGRSGTKIGAAQSMHRCRASHLEHYPTATLGYSSHISN